MVGEFEKPRYVEYKAEICAHARNRKTGCTRCLDVCPASAIAPDGDHVAIDPFICGGCGACHSVCLTGAASYALPPATALLERLRTLLSRYYEAGGERAVLLVHDEIGRASCRERVCQSVLILVVAVVIKKKKNNYKAT